MHKKILVVIPIFVLSASSVLAGDKDLLLYLPLEGTLENKVTGEVGEAKYVSFQEGKVGQGVYFDVSSYLRFPAKDNINYRQGTVEFWVKPSWDGDDNGYHYFFAGNITDARNVNSLHVSKKRYQGGVILGQIDSKADETGRAIEEAVVPGGRDVSPSSVAHWKRGEWHHLAFSWDAQSKKLKLYLDGLLRATNDRVPDAAFPSGYQDFINIGSSIDDVVFAESTMDELKVWDSPRTDLQIAESAGLSPLGEGDSGKNDAAGEGSGGILGRFLDFLRWVRDFLSTII